MNSIPEVETVGTVSSGWAEFALAVGGFGIGTGEFVMMGLLPDVASNFNVSIPAAGHIISAYALGVVVGAPLISVAAARWSRQRLLLALMAFFAVGNFASALAPGYTSLLGIRFLAELPQGAQCTTRWACHVNGSIHLESDLHRLGELADLGMPQNCGMQLW